MRTSTTATSSRRCAGGSPFRAPARSRNAPRRCRPICATRWCRRSLRSVSPAAPSTIRRGDGPPFLVAERIEDPDALTVLVYGHGDTVRGLDDLWRPGLAPWTLEVEGDRIYGRGTADNKGQHSINIAALAAVLAERGRLGFNVKFLIEMGEEVGSDRPARTVRAAQGWRAARRPADRLRRAAHCARQADAVSRRARRPPDRPDRRPARGRPPLRQLGRPDLERRHRAGAGAGLHHRRARRDQGAGMAADAVAFGPRIAQGRRGRRRQRRARGRAATGASPA